MRTATIYNFLLEANLMASIAIVLMLLVRKLFRKQIGNRAIYFAWLLVAIRLLCPLTLPNPWISEIRPMNQQDEAIRPIPAQLQIRFSDASQSLLQWSQNTTGSESVVSEGLDHFVDSTFDGSLSERLIQLYCIGALVVLAWFAFSNLRFRYRMRADRIEPISGQLLEQYQQLCKTRKVKPVPVYFTDPMPCACLIGVFRPYIALPLTVAPQEAMQVLTHEICHLKGRDPYWALLRLACCALHWFNPLVWIAAYLSRTDGELACDDRVIAKLDSKERLSYANVLVLAAAKKYAPAVGVLATGMTMTGKKLKTRVGAILRSHEVKRGAALAFAIVSCMLLVGAFATGESHAILYIPTVESAAALAKADEIATEDDAIAYAKQIWTLPSLGENIDDASWQVDREGNTFYVYTNWEKQPNRMLRVTMNQSGQLLGLNNFGGFYEYGEARHWYENDASTQNAVRDFVTGFANSFELPAQPILECVEEVGQSENYFMVYHGYSSENAKQENRCTEFVVQVKPTVRIIRYSPETIYSTDDGANG